MQFLLVYLKRIVLSLIALCVFSGSVARAQADDLITAYQQAAASSPVLAQARALLRADKASRLVARSALLPKVGARAGVSGNQVNIQGFGEDFLGSSKDIKSTYTGGNYSVTLTQPVINGQAWAAVRAADFQIRAGQAAVMAAEQDLIRQVAETYFQVLQAQADERVASGQKDLLKEILAQTEADLRVGSGDIIAVQEAKARYDTAISSLVRSRNTVQIARQRLQRLTHQPVGPLADLGSVKPQGPKPNQIEPWLQAAKENQPVLTQARDQLRAARAQVEVARRAHWPSLNLDAGYGYIKGNFLPSIESRQAQVGLSLSVPIYQGGEIIATTQRANAQAMASRHQLENLEDQVNLDTESAFLDLRNSVSQLRAATQAMASAKTSLQATRKGYDVGARSIIDLLTTAQAYERAQRDYYLALYNQVVARVRLKAAAGIISIKDIEAINALLKQG